MAKNPYQDLTSYINKRAVKAGRQLHLKDKMPMMPAETYNFIYPLFLKDVKSGLILPQDKYNTKTFNHYPFFGISIFSWKYNPGTILFHLNQVNVNEDVVVWHGTNLLVLRDNKVLGHIEDGIAYMQELGDLIEWN